MADAKAPRPKPAHPTFLMMAKEAIEELAEKKGSSVPSIKAYIIEQYNLDPVTARVHLKAALAKGLESETFLRPKNSEAKGFTGRFKVNKVKTASEEKEKLKKEKAKEKKESSKAKPVKKTAAKDKKATKTAKSPKAKKTAAGATKVKKPVRKSPKKTTKAAKPKAALKTPKKTVKQLKVTGTPKASKK